MTFIEVKGPSNEEAWLDTDSIESVEWYDPSGRLAIRTKAGRTYYDTVKPAEFLKKHGRPTLPPPVEQPTLPLETKETKRG